MLEVIEKRRSCRNFDTERNVEEEKVNEVIQAGLYAANGMGKQAGIIIAITSKKVTDAFRKINADIMGREKDPFYGAPVILLVAVRKSPIAPYDGACMIENMMLEATAQGLGSCWIHRAKEELLREDVKNLLSSTGLNLEEYEGVGHVALGYALSEAPEKTIHDGRVYFIR